MFLISVLYRLATRLDSFYRTAAKELLLQPERELNPARTRWNIIRSKIEDGSFFILCEPLKLGSLSNHFRSWQQILHHVKFKDIIFRAKEAVANESRLKKTQGEIQDIRSHRGLAACHIARATSLLTVTLASESL